MKKNQQSKKNFIIAGCEKGSKNSWKFQDVSCPAEMI